MATVRIYLDTRREKREGFPVKIVIYHKKQFMINTNISVLRSEFKNGEIISGQNYRTKNTNILNLRASIENKLLDLERSGEINFLSDKQLKDKLTGSTEKTSFISVYEEFMNKKTGRTKEIYQRTLEKIQNFDNPDFESITHKWLSDFDRHLSRKNSINTRAIDLRNIRAVFNYALDNDYTNSYPFRKYKIKKEATRHKNLTVDEIRELIAYDGKWAHFRDCFMLSFYLIGMNLKDLLTAKKSDLKRGRLNYRRLKTGKLYSIKIEPEAMEIINKYKDNEYLVNFIRSYKDYSGYKRAISYALKLITNSMNEIIDKDLSTYYARHSWASIASELDIPKETISAALGHEIGSQITSIYINFDQKKVDEANMKVIDKVTNRH